MDVVPGFDIAVHIDIINYKDIGVVLVKFINLVIGFDLDVICVDLDVVIGVDLDVVIGVDHYVQFLFMDKRAMVTPKHCSFSQCCCHCC